MRGHITVWMYWKGNMSLATWGAEVFAPTFGDRSTQRRPAAAPAALYKGADPWITRCGDVWFSCNARSDGSIEVHRTHHLSERGKGRVVWSPPRHGWNCDEVWAPELHCIAGRWYIYYAASDGHNANHRMGVLRATTIDPQGPYEDLGMLYTGDDVAGRSGNRWAIDGTPLMLRGQLYFLWSGWQDERDIQHLFIARMSDPATIASGRVQIAANNCHAWEHVSDDRRNRGLHEGPALLRRHGKLHLIYSCSGSWETTYKLGLLHMPLHADPMNPQNWTKHPTPILAPTPDHFGVGHCSFTTDEHGRDVIFYHSKQTRRQGWTDRTVHARTFGWTDQGLPDLTHATEIATVTTRAPRRVA